MKGMHREVPFTRRSAVNEREIPLAAELDLFNDSFFRVRTDGPVTSFLWHSSQKEIFSFYNFEFFVH